MTLYALYAYHVGAIDIDTYLHSRKGYMQIADRGYRYSIKVYYLVFRIPMEDFFTIAEQPQGPRPPHFRGHMITLRHTTLGSAPLDYGISRVV